MSKLLKILLLFTMYTTGYAQANTIEVCTTCQYNSVKDAIAKANAHDTIIIKSGTYKEHSIVIDNSIQKQIFS